MAERQNVGGGTRADLNEIKITGENKANFTVTEL